MNDSIKPAAPAVEPSPSKADTRAKDTATRANADVGELADESVSAKAARPAQKAASAPVPPVEEARERRRQEALEALEKRFLHVNDTYFHKGGRNVAFTDRGSKLVTQERDQSTAAAMATLAVAKGWTSIKVSGTQDFRREAWFEASLQGLSVKGYSPSREERDAVEAMREARANTVQRVPEDPDLTAELQRRSRQRQAAENDKAQRVPEGSARLLLQREPDHSLAGVVLEHGRAPYQHDPKESMSYFVKLATLRGERVLWSIDLERSFAGDQVKIGEDVRLEYKGKQPVTVSVPTRDATGQVLGYREVATHRNTWEVSARGQVIEAVAARVVAQTVRDKGAQERVMNEVRHRLDERMAKGQPIAAVKVYDAKAPQQTRQTAARPPVERNVERTRG